jgi:hypothetical protein
MFSILPEDIELLIYKKYFSKEVIREIIMKATSKINKRIRKRIFLNELRDYSIFIKAGKIINSIIDKNITMDDDNISKLDEMFNSLVDLHKNGVFDIFQI